VPLLKLQNHFQELFVYDSNSNDDTLVGTGCSTPISGASSPKKRGACKKACLIPCPINYFIVTIIVHKFIEKLKRRIIPKKIFPSYSQTQKRNHGQRWP
jgi:hypothetical protein